MKSLFFIPIIFILSWILQLWFPWWIISIVCAAICFMMRVPIFSGFAGSLLIIFLLWVIKAYFADQHFDVPMSGILGELIGNISSSAVFILTGLIGGVVGGFSGLIGSWLSSMMYPPK
ncbi:MAG: hypothetical protein WAU01_00715 [Saprospiraceae bacterium]